MISAKKFSLPKMSRKSAAACSASSYWPRRRRVCTSPLGQPVVAMRPLAYWLQQLAVHAGLEVVALDATRATTAGTGCACPRVRLGRAASCACTRPSRTRRRSAAVCPSARGSCRRGACRGEVGLGADDRLDAGRGGRLPEVEGAELVAVVGDRDRRHALLDRGLDQRSRPAPHRRASSTRCARAGGRRNRIRWPRSSCSSRRGRGRRHADGSGSGGV